MKKPEDRTPAIQALAKKAGATVKALYMTAGENDVVVVVDAPDGDTAAALSMAVSSSGSLAKCQTVRAWTGAEFSAVAGKAADLASAYSPPGS